MDLKEFQRRVADEVECYLEAVAREREAGNQKHASKDAWEALSLGRYEEMRNGLGRDLPVFSIKVPTGGGKTLLATQILGSIYRTILKDRNGSGLVLWVVPSSQIYRDTLRRLRDRGDLYRVMLEHAVSRRIEVWEKQDVARLSPTRLRENLNILVLQLASTNRETKEQLKFFRDSGGRIVEHFPPEDDPAANKRLKAEIPNLDMIEDDEAAGRHLVATSIGNLVRLAAPPVILDEGHRATSELARSTLRGFNASVVVELSATPPRGANIVSRVSGEELLREEMIKLPLNIATSGQRSWKDILTQARDRREGLAKIAGEHEASGGPQRHIRPIVLVQVERTGKDQRERGYIHARDAEEFLEQRLSVARGAIAVKTAEDDGLEDVDLLDPGCPIEWIITKSALQEGWDCPFAYILVSLSETRSGRSMTQLVGRVLRQPYQERTPFPELNECYIYCLHAKAIEIARQVKAALEKEGYEGEAESIVADISRGEPERTPREIRIKKELRERYTKPFRGKVYLPRFCVEEDGEYRALDYFEHLIRRVDVERLEYEKIDWRIGDALKDAKDRFYRLALNSDLASVQELDAAVLESDDQVLAWLTANLRFEFLSHKQLRVAVRRVYDRLRATVPAVAGKLALVKFDVRQRIEAFLQGGIDWETERAFGDLFDAGRIRFYLECADCRFEIPEKIRIERKVALKPVAHPDGKLVQKTLFDFEDESNTNEYERAVALVLDRHADVLWWFRNRVGPQFFTVQGYRKQRIYPDFIVQQTEDSREHHRVLVIESKGEHLEGNPDTEYKRKVASYFEKAGKRVTWQQLGSEFKDHVFRFQVLDEAQDLGRSWQDELCDLLSDATRLGS
jgi:type III restriction enzyme